MKNTFIIAFFSLLSLVSFGKKADTRVFEMRVYYAAEGKLPTLVERFQKHTIFLFERHGMQNIGYWLPLHNEQNRIIYILAYPSMQARDSSWKAFGSDEEWKKVAAASEANGKVVLKVESTFMKAADFSPKIVSSLLGNRVFELRTYYPSANKFSDLLARFRNHTMALFTRHGMQNVAYFTTVEKDNVQPKLVYILGHKSEEGGKQAFDEFGKDPNWVKVKTASEVNGKIVDSITSVYMDALPFSKIR